MGKSLCFMFGVDQSSLNMHYEKCLENGSSDGYWAAEAQTIKNVF